MGARKKFEAVVFVLSTTIERKPETSLLTQVLKVAL